MFEHISLQDFINFERRRFLKAGTAGAATLALGSLPKLSSAQSAGHIAVIIGAGIAGLAAAVKLKAAGLQVIVLEARNRSGGRIWTDRSVLGFACDMGAGWIHGPDGANPITPLAKQANATTYLTSDDSVQVFDSTGKDVTTVQSGDAAARYKKLLADLDALALTVPADISIWDAIARINPALQTDPYIIYQLTAFDEFDAGGPAEKLSLYNWKGGSKFPGKDVVLPAGYDAITNLLAQGIDVRLNQVVSSVNYSGQVATITTNVGSFTANYVVVTVPLGVLKKGSISFTPALPAALQTSINKVEMGTINKVFCQFDSAFWPTDTQYFGYHAPTKGLFAYWLNYRTFSSINCLVGIAIGNGGALIDNMSDAQVSSTAFDALKVMFGAAAKAPTKVNASRWNIDPFAYGSYSYGSLGTLPADFTTMAATVSNKLFFAGEHTSTLYKATAHGAYLSGIAAADKIIAQVGSVPAVTVVNYSGLWANPAESGWGINFAHQSDIIFATWFTYDASGKCLWISMTAVKNGTDYTGTLVETRAQFSTVSFNPTSVTRTNVGTGKLSFTDTKNGTFTYTLLGVTQTKAIAPLVFGTLPGCTFGAENDLTLATNYQDLWWGIPAGTEDGWGVNFAHQGDNIFATWYTYDIDGAALWLTATLARTSGTKSYTGQVVRTTGPAYSATPFLSANVVRIIVGTMTVTFTNGNLATMAYTVNNITQSKQISRGVFVSPGTVCQ